MKIAFIGYGNMANALVSSILLSKNIDLTSDIHIFHNKNNYFLLFISLFLFLNSLYAGWHAGIEWGFWEGPQTCAALKNNYSNNLLEVLKSSSSAPQCNEASLRIFGLSLAGYNFIISLMSSLVLLNKVRKVL